MRAAFPQQPSHEKNPFLVAGATTGTCWEPGLLAPEVGLLPAASVRLLAEAAAWEEAFDVSICVIQLVQII